ncbi:hypothetical protein, partial [Cylindrospermopsis raciborskii]
MSGRRSRKHQYLKPKFNGSPPTPLKKQGVFKVGGKLQNDFLKTLFHTAIAAFFRNFGLINIKNQPKH